MCIFTCCAAVFSCQHWNRKESRDVMVASSLHCTMQVWSLISGIVVLALRFGTAVGLSEPSSLRPFAVYINHRPLSSPVLNYCYLELVFPCAESLLSYGVILYPCIPVELRGAVCIDTRLAATCLATTNLAIPSLTSILGTSKFDDTCTGTCPFQYTHCHCLRTRLRSCNCGFRAVVF